MTALKKPQAYDVAASRHFGEFAVLNFPLGDKFDGSEK